MARFVNRVGSNPRLLSSNVEFLKLLSVTHELGVLARRVLAASPSSPAPPFPHPHPVPHIPGNLSSLESLYVIPISAMYTPIKPFSDMPVLPYSPLRCRNCRSVLNPFSVIDFEAKIWICPICFHRNHPLTTPSPSPQTPSPRSCSPSTPPSSTSKTPCPTPSCPRL
ncbi:hypothetical protein Tsubulata_012501 [Turnera subulata]|uniref:Protein transport protein SEC23 n=1 Tax=Turnera subulata TaxID=218843 RepID=A0A9Q0J1U4_9ROSI|nr:hypothetical protein Tsubulata_012501 [Turnera subulata]